MRKLNETKELKLVLPALLLILLAANVVGIGIARDFNSIQFVPNEEITLQFYVYNDERKDGAAVISVAGSLENLTHINPSIVNFTSGEEMIPFLVNIELPEKPEGELVIKVESVPGKQEQITGRVVVVQRLQFSEQREIRQPLSLTGQSKDQVKEVLLPTQKITFIKSFVGKTLLYIAMFATLINVILYAISIKNKKQEPTKDEKLDQAMLDYFKKGFELGLPEELLVSKLKMTESDKEKIDRHLWFAKGEPPNTEQKEVKESEQKA